MNGNCLQIGKYIVTPFFLPQRMEGGSHPLPVAAFILNVPRFETVTHLLLLWRRKVLRHWLGRWCPNLRLQTPYPSASMTSPMRKINISGMNLPIVSEVYRSVNYIGLLAK